MVARQIISEKLLGHWKRAADRFPEIDWCISSPSIKAVEQKLSDLISECEKGNTSVESLKAVADERINAYLTETELLKGKF